jgi:hypothetical protein
MDYEGNHRRRGFRRGSARKPDGRQGGAKGGLAPEFEHERKSTHKTRKWDFGLSFSLFQPEQAATQCVPTEMRPRCFVPIRGKSCSFVLKKPEP